MPTKERAARERATKAQHAAQQAGMPPALQRVISELRGAGIEVLVHCERTDPGAASQMHTADRHYDLGTASGRIHGDSPKVEPAREIPLELNMLHGAISDLALEFDALDSRLVHISTPVLNGAAGTDSACSEPSLSSLGDQIRAARQRIQAVTASINARASRLGV